MLLQTNSYIVPKDKRAQHARLVHRFRQTLTRLGCDHFEAYEQVGANWSPADTTGRFVQLMRFRDRKQQLAVQAAERNDPTAQALIKEFCELINFPYQQQQGLFAVGFYHSLLPTQRSEGGDATGLADETNSDEFSGDSIEPRGDLESADGGVVNGTPAPGEPAIEEMSSVLDQQVEPLSGEPMDVEDFLADDSASDLEPLDEIEVNEKRR